MLPEINILGVSIATFGLMVVVALVVTLAMLVRRAEELQVPREWATEASLAAVVGGFVGARLYGVAERGGETANLVQGGGFVLYGGVAGAAVAVFAWSRLREVPFTFVDVPVPVVAAVPAIMRIGCQLSGDGDYGSPSDLPWAMGYPDGTVPTPPGVEVHPTPIYEALALGLLAVWLWRKRDAYRPGVLLGALLVFFGLERLLVEFVRRNDEVALGLTAPQLQSLVLIAAGALLLAVLKRRPAPTLSSLRARNRLA